MHQGGGTAGPAGGTATPAAATAQLSLQPDGRIHTRAAEQLGSLPDRGFGFLGGAPGSVDHQPLGATQAAGRLSSTPQEGGTPMPAIAAGQLGDLMANIPGGTSPGVTDPGMAFLAAVRHRPGCRIDVRSWVAYGEE